MHRSFIVCVCQAINPNSARRRVDALEARGAKIEALKAKAVAGKAKAAGKGKPKAKAKAKSQETPEARRLA